MVMTSFSSSLSLPRSYNTIISACSKAGQPAAAARVYERMLVRDGAGSWLERTRLCLGAGTMVPMPCTAAAAPLPAPPMPQCACFPSLGCC